MSTKQNKRNFALSMLTVSMLSISGNSIAGEVPIGDSHEMNGMEIAAVYLQAIKMEPMLPGMMDPKDIHLEADIHALKGNKNGYGEGEWIPYLTISYNLTKKGSKWSHTSNFMPMIASDGMHYGENVKLDGPGKYHVTFHIQSPASMGFGRHTDKETGVGKWYKPFDVEWDFNYVGTGKKGGY